jgi:hypothetical protein
LSTAECAICGRPVAADHRYCDTCDFQAEPAAAGSAGVHSASRGAAFRNKGPEIRIFFAVFLLAAVTTTVLGMGGPLAIPGLRDSLGLAPDSSSVAQWGELRWVHVASRIRGARSTDSPIIGRLQPGDSVRVDFAGAGWYAVFPATATKRVEDRAIGYVFGRLLKESPPPPRERTSGTDG